MAIQPAAKTIVLSGGGTGGHITPILAVAHELKKQDPTVRTIYIGERGGKFQELTATHEAIDEIYTIWAGKFRRYHGESWLRRLFAVRTNLLNVRDLFYFLFGTVQSWFLLRKIRPDVVFLKGGFVGVPVGIAARLLHKPFVTHDSDALPGLANRLVGRWAALHAVAMAPETYVYPQENTVQVGVLVEPHFQFVGPKEQAEMKKTLEIPGDSSVVLITGGSSGATNVNEAVVSIAQQLLADFPKLTIIHQTGKGKSAIYGGYHHDRLKVVEFMRPMYVYTGAADVVVSRASGNTVAELGVQGKAVIVVPNPLLTGGHQLKNAQALADSQAALVVSETPDATDAPALDAAIRELLHNSEKRARLATRLHEITLTNAAQKLAAIILKQ